MKIIVSICLLAVVAGGIYFFQSAPKDNVESAQQVAKDQAAAKKEAEFRRVKEPSWGTPVILPKGPEPEPELDNPTEAQEVENEKEGPKKPNKMRSMIVGFFSEEEEEEDDFSIFAVDKIEINESPDTVEEYVQRLEDVKLPEDLSDEKIAEMVEQLFVDGYATDDMQRLYLVGKRAIPFLFKALDDPRTYQTKFQYSVGFESPFARICSLISHNPSVDTLGKLSRFLRHHDSHFRGEAAFLVGAIGHDKCLPHLLAICENNSESIKMMTRGVGKALATKRCSNQFVAIISRELGKLMRSHDHKAHYWCAEAILDGEATKAIDILTAAEIFNVDYPYLNRSLLALNRSEAKIPLERLKPLLSDLRRAGAAKEWTYSAALLAYGRNADESARSYLESEIDSELYDVAEAAKEAILLTEGIDNPRDYVFEIFESRGFKALTLPQKLYLAVYDYDLEVSLYGFQHYFNLEVANRWKYAYRGLESMGAKSQLSIMKRALGSFGKKGPPIDLEQRRERVKGMSDTTEQAWQKMKSRMFLFSDDLDLCMFRYVLKNAAHFRKTK